MATITLDENDPIEMEYQYCAIEHGNGSTVRFLISYYDSFFEKVEIEVLNEKCKLKGFESIYSLKYENLGFWAESIQRPDCNFFTNSVKS